MIKNIPRSQSRDLQSIFYGTIIRESVRFLSTAATGRGWKNTRAAWVTWPGAHLCHVSVNILSNSNWGIDGPITICKTVIGLRQSRLMNIYFVLGRCVKDRAELRYLGVILCNARAIN